MGQVGIGPSAPSMIEHTAEQTGVPKIDVVAKRGRQAIAARLLFEGVAASVACLLVVTSAVAAKRAALGPALVAIEPAPVVEEAPLDLVAALPEVAPAPVTAELSGPPEIADPSIVTPEAGHVRYFNGRPIRPKRTIWMTVTAYSPDERSCGDSADGITSTNHSVWTNAMNLVAADPKVLPMRSMISVPGYADGRVVPVLDVGGAIKGARLDVLYATHAIARKWGVQRIPVTVWEYADQDAK